MPSSFTLLPNEVKGYQNTIGTNDNADDGKDLTTQVYQDRIGEATSDPKATGPTEKVREKAAEMTDKNQESEEPV
jgi:hypothetical protein